MTHKFKIGDTGLTRNGWPYRVIADDVKKKLPLAVVITRDDGLEYVADRAADGKPYCGEDSPRDLMPPVQSVYINVYVYGDGNGRMYCQQQYLTRDEADKNASGERHSCIRVELVRGRFDG